MDTFRPVDVLLVDDHRVFAEVLADHLRGAVQVARVELALSVDEARVVLRGFSPQLVLLDDDVAGVPGTDLLEALGPPGSRPRVVMVSASTDPGRVIAALRAGADGWVDKAAHPDVLLEAAEAVLRGHLYLDLPLVRPVVEGLLAAQAVAAPTFVDQLSAREVQVLRLLVAGLTRSEVAHRLYISPNTVRTHVQRLLKRAGVHTTVALVAAARNAGVEPPPRDAEPVAATGGDRLDSSP